MESEMQFRKLFEPFRIGEMELKNRIVRAPMHTPFSNTEGYVTDQLLDYYEELAKGGCGLVIVENTSIDAIMGKSTACQLVIDDDKFIPGMRKLAQVIQKNGAKAALQLYHAGRVAPTAVTGGIQPVAPSAIAAPLPECVLPRELTIAEIKELVARFANGAERAKRAGFDAVEVLGSRHYLINQFLSPASNKRNDTYGGSLENRARFLLEIMEATRQLVGQAYPLWPRLNGMEYGIPGGIRIEHTEKLSQMVESASADAIHIMALHPVFPHPPMCEPPGSIVHLAEAIKKVVSVPVITGGKITPEVGERVLREGRADFVSIGKALWADPELPNKVASGRLDDITPCLDCRRCLEVLHETGSLSCTVNAALGREREYRITPTKKAKKVLVIGGGPAGLEAARIAALRKHEVILYEKEERLGGQMTLAARPPHKDGVEALTDYLSHQVRKLGVRIETGKEVTSVLIGEIKPDAVVMATGIVPLIPDITGVDRDNVVTAQDILSEKVKFGKKVIVLGGALVGCETAEFLADKGREVTIIEVLPEIAAKVGIMTKSFLLKRLAEKGVTMLAGVKPKEITAEGMLITDEEGQNQLIEGDTIVIAVGASPNRTLLNELKEGVPEIHLAGDCVEPRDIMGAIADGARIGRAL